MKKYIGTKTILAIEMTRGDYADSYEQGNAALPDLTKAPNDAGYLVEYDNGYKAWSPKDVFEAAYYEVDGMTLGQAIEAAKAGQKIQRADWNGRDMFVVYMPSLYLPPYDTADTARKVNDRTAKWIGEDQPLDCQPYLAMYNAQKQWIPGWVASQSDMLASDWRIL